jgi:hypothetical protein
MKQILFAIGRFRPMSIPTSNPNAHAVVEDYQTLPAVLQHNYPLSKVEVCSSAHISHSSDPDHG